MGGIEERLCAINETGAFRTAAWRFMQRYQGQTPYHSFMVFYRGKSAAAEISLTADGWHLLNLAMWRLKVEQVPLFEDLSAQRALF